MSVLLIRDRSMKLATLQPIPLELRRMLSLVGVSGLVSLNLVAISLLMRRAFFAGEGLSPGVVFGGGVVAIGFSVALRELAAVVPLAVPKLVVPSLGTLATLLACLALSIAPTSVVAAIAVWMIAIVAEGAYWYRQSGTDRIRSLWHRANQRAGSDDNLPTDQRAPATADLDSIDDEEESETLAADVLSQLTRSRSESGGEVIYGLLRAEFAVGERQQWLNVAFCPPLLARPSCTAHFADGANALLEVEEVETYGARLMVRLPKAAEESRSLVVEMFVEMFVESAAIQPQS